MKIACIPVAGMRQVFTICFGDEEVKRIHASIHGKKPALPDNCTSLAELENFLEEIEFKGAKQYAYKRLALKAFSSTILARELKQRLVSEYIIQKIISELTHLGYLNDEDWLKSFVTSQSSKRRGPNTIRYKLKEQGVDEETIQQALKHISSQEQHNSIKKLLVSKYKHKDLTTYKERQKVIGSLVRRGFDLDAILSILQAED